MWTRDVKNKKKDESEATKKNQWCGGEFCAALPACLISNFEQSADVFIKFYEFTARSERRSGREYLSAFVTEQEREKIQKYDEFSQSARNQNSI